MLVKIQVLKFMRNLHKHFGKPLVNLLAYKVFDFLRIGLSMISLSVLVDETYPNICTNISSLV